ncbi:MAG: replicative DNA helicase [Eubacteriales bacterium]|nr:replicative DNA helicase [Eubacteriales bacterium]MDD3880912.1 replicative DNA helicase [Eubacteriales bacterium]MDD4511721.1 replicative DNA helicase [Eubacteriales bacterium]
MQGNPLANNIATPPNSQEAERCVLGSMMQDNASVVLALELLHEEDFYAPAHKEMFSAARELNASGAPVDMVTMDTLLSSRGTLEGIGGVNYLLEVSANVPTTANVRAYINIVLEKSTLRRLIGASQAISQDCYSGQDVSTTLSAAEKRIFEITMHRRDGASLTHISELLPQTYEHIEELSRLKGKTSGVPTGFIDLDNVLTGLHPGELVLVGARPGMGKTSFSMNVCQYAAMVAGKKTAVFSLEMPSTQIVMRMLCSEAKVNMQNVRRGILSDQEWMRLAGVLGPMSNSPLYIDDTAGLTPSQVRSRLRKLMMEKGLDLAMIDYMQLMAADTKTESRQLEVSEISRQLKSIALELKIPIIACAQLSRANTNRQDKRPMLNDIRDSGSIEQDADVVLFLHREGYYDPAVEDRNKAEVIVAKQRNGPLGTVFLAWLSDYATYANMATRQQEYGG